MKRKNPTGEVCSTVDCYKPVDSRGLCSACWTRRKRNGTLPPRKRDGILLGRSDVSADERFKARSIASSEDKCWEWIGGKDKDGYGLICVDGKIMGAHRYSYIKNVGKIPQGKCVLHRCDNPGCVNPSHLFIGSNLDNVIDREMKGRGGRSNGECNGAHKLNASDVIRLRAECNRGGKTFRMLAMENGVSEATIGRIAKNKTWRHL